MPSYEPVDLSGICNAGVEVLGDEPDDVPLGRVDLRGLPFLIGPEPPSAERCLLLPGAPTSVGIGRLARRVIIAHRLLEPGAPAGHAVGQTVAEYAFHLAGGEVVVAPIRERFEIQVVPTEWGRLPFLAVPDTSDGNRCPSTRPPRPRPRACPAPSLAGPGRVRLRRVTPERPEPPPRGEEHPDDEHADAHPQVDVDLAGLGQVLR
jgi:hypothetical protein